MQNDQTSPPDFQSMILTKGSMIQMNECNVVLEQYFNTASQDLKEQTELGNQGLQVSFLGMAAVQTRADKRVLDLQQSPNTDWPPLLPVETLHESIDRGIVIFLQVLLLKHRNFHIQRG